MRSFGIKIKNIRGKKNKITTFFKPEIGEDKKRRKQEKENSIVGNTLNDSL